MNDKVLPFEPEPLDAMRQRWPQVLTVTYDLKQIENRQQENPVLQRRHVFDFDDGIRMAASIENMSPAPPELHLSFGIHESFFQAVWVTRGQPAWLERCHWIVEEFRMMNMITTPQTSKFLTKRAYHLWFKK